MHEYLIKVCTRSNSMKNTRQVGQIKIKKEPKIFQTYDLLVILQFMRIFYVNL